MMIDYEEALCEVSDVLRAHNKVVGGISHQEACKLILEAVRPKSKWITQPYSMIIRCSVCGNEETKGTDRPFCSNCGANMVTDLCSICKHGDNCERSDKGISFANHSACWKFER